MLKRPELIKIKILNTRNIQMCASRNVSFVRCRTQHCSFRYDVQYCHLCCATLHAHSHYYMNLILCYIEIKRVTEGDDSSALDVCW